MANAALVACHLALRDAARDLREMLAPYTGQLLGQPTGWMGSGEHFVGMLDTVLGRWEDADAHFRAAEGVHARIGAPTWLARSRLEWARMLLRRDGGVDGEHVRELLGRALTTARALGLGNVERRALALTPR